MQVPPDDNQARAVCPACGTIHYINPLVIVGTLPIYQDKVLLCKRNIEPRWGTWTLPAGFMELEETTQQGAARETVEEAGAEFTMGDLYAVMNVTSVGQVHLFYRCTLLHDRFDPGSETLEARLFAPEDIPWKNISFPTVSFVLRAWIEDNKKGVHASHIHTLDFTERHS